MGSADRTYEDIIKGLNEAESILINLGGCAKKLRTEAETASSELKDKIGKQDIDDLTSLADAISNAVNPGVERIRELIRQAEKENRLFEDLER